MTIETIQNEIKRLKKEKDICILAHSYQAREILEVADYTGDSFMLSLKAEKATEKNMLVCGVRFMAETVKILSPDKKVILANPTAGCPMAEQMDKKFIEKMKEENPDHTVVAYVNTTAELKTVCDVCVTSSSAVKIVEKIDNDKILFIPDCNLGAYVAEKLPEKEIKLLQGGCPIHTAVDREEVIKAKNEYPNAKVLVHPECIPSVVELADFVGSTSAIMDYAIESDCKEFIIGTELSIAEHLQYQCPEKKFYALSKKLICPDMKMTTLMDVYNAIKGDTGEEILLDKDTIEKAKLCINRMIELG